MSWADATTETSLIEMFHPFNSTINQIKVQDHRSLAEMANTLGRELSESLIVLHFFQIKYYILKDLVYILY